MRFGRISGWKATYHRPGTAGTRGPLVIDSRIDLFRERAGASQDLEAYAAVLREELRPARAVRGERLSPPRIGDAALAWSMRQPAAAGAVRFFVVAWRYTNATASVAVNGFEGHVGLEDALSLARRQQRRLAAAAR